MFRIDKRLVNLAASRSVSVDAGPEEDAAEDERQNAPAASAYVDAAAQEILNEAEKKAEEALGRAREEAEAMIQAAHAETESMLQDARGQIEEAYVQAKQEGYSEGEREGRHAYDAKIAEDDIKLARAVEEIHGERVRMYDGLEEKITTLALSVVKKIFNPAEEVLGDVFRSLVLNALKQIKLTEKIIIRVGPAEYERFFSSGHAVFELHDGVTATATVLKDMSFNDGDCVIDTDFETVNAGLDSQLKYIQLAFGNVND